MSFNKWITKNKTIFYLLQEACRKKKWKIDFFPKRDQWSLDSFKCNLLGFILGSLKCPACNEVDCLYGGSLYDSFNIYCECGAKYYESCGFDQFGIHAAAVVKRGSKVDY